MPTLSDLRTAVRRKLDRVNAATPSDAEINDWINAGAAELWDLLVTTYEDQFSTYRTTAETKTSPLDVSSLTTFFNTVAVNEHVRLFKLRAVQYSINGEWCEVQAIPLQEHWKYETTASLAAPLGYTLIGNRIHILPSTIPAQTYRLYYVPCYVKMVSDSDELFSIDGQDSFVVPNRWDEYIVFDACISARIKLQQDASLEMAKKAELKQRIKGAASNRTPGQSRKVVERATHRSRN